MDVYFEPLDDIELTREMVAEETSLPRLKAWWRHLSESAEDLKIRIQTAREGGRDPYSMSAKMGFIRVALNWIEKRIIVLEEGASPDPDMKGKYERLTAEIERLTDALKNRNHVIAALHDRLARYGE